MRHFTISAVLKHVVVSNLRNLLQECAVLHFLLLLRVLRQRNSFVVDQPDCAFEGLKSGVVALLIGLDETGASNRMQTRVEFCFSLKFFKPANPGFS